MPIIEMHLMEGRTVEQKRAVAQAVTEAVTHSLGVKQDTVRILITEHGDEEFFVGGMNMAQRAAAQRARAEAEEKQ